MMFTLVALLTMAASARAMSYEQARNEALFLTDKMAYELNLTDAQYEAAYEINLDYLMGVTSQYDVFGPYWERRNLDLSYILFSWQWDAFCAASYFYRPLYWNAGYWHFGIYARYPHRDYFYFGRPHFYISYRGGHSWRMNGGHSFYEGRRDHYRPGHIDRDHHFGMRNGWDRGDYRNNHGGGSSTNHGNRGFRDRNGRSDNFGNRGNNNGGSMGNHDNRNNGGSMGNHDNRNGGSLDNHSGRDMHTRSMNNRSNDGVYSNSHGNFGGSRSNGTVNGNSVNNGTRGSNGNSVNNGTRGNVRSNVHGAPSSVRNTPAPSMRSNTRNSAPSQSVRSNASSSVRSSAPAMRSSSSSSSRGSMGGSRSSGGSHGGHGGGNHGGGSHGNFGGSRR